MHCQYTNSMYCFTAITFACYKITSSSLSKVPSLDRLAWDYISLTEMLIQNYLDAWLFIHCWATIILSSCMNYRKKSCKKSEDRIYTCIGFLLNTWNASALIDKNLRNFLVSMFSSSSACFTYTDKDKQYAYKRTKFIKRNINQFSTVNHFISS